MAKSRRFFTTQIRYTILFIFCVLLIVYVFIGFDLFFLFGDDVDSLEKPTIMINAILPPNEDQINQLNENDVSAATLNDKPTKNEINAEDEQELLMDNKSAKPIIPISPSPVSNPILMQEPQTTNFKFIEDCIIIEHL